MTEKVAETMQHLPNGQPFDDHFIPQMLVLGTQSDVQVTPSSPFPEDTSEASTSEQD